MNSNDKILPPHHVQNELCTTRPLYRQGRKLTAVKVYTINSESQHLLIYDVPKINLNDELRSLCMRYGNIKTFEVTTRYKTEDFTECFHVQYERIQSSRIAKRFMDTKSFYGGHLHVCYAPEFENIKETMEKIQQREKDVLSRLEPGPSTLEYVNYKGDDTHTQQNRKRKNPALPITEKRLRNESGDIWENIPSYLDPRIKTSDNAKVGMKKHFEIPKNLKKGVEYGPYVPEDVDLNTCRSQMAEPHSSNGERTVRTTLLPTSVIKNYNSTCNKIIFRRK